MKPNAQTAIAVLKIIRKKLGPEHLAYWITPNTILTLSGARAYCDGVFWDKPKSGSLQKWRREIADSLAIIKQHMSVVWSEVNVTEARPGETYAGYDCIFESGLRYVLEHNEILKNVSMDQLNTQASPKDFMGIMMADLKSQARFKNYSHEDLNHIAFGVLLGYPDKAVESLPHWEKNPDKPRESLVDANVKYGKYYVCPQPIYSYPPSLAGDPSIVAHEKLWSKILTDYYTSQFHVSLEADKSFIKKLKEIGNLK